MSWFLWEQGERCHNSRNVSAWCLFLTCCLSVDAQADVVIVGGGGSGGVAVRVVQRMGRRGLELADFGRQIPGS